MLAAVSFELFAKLPISSATTANPLPDSPALAASILAFKLNKFVCVVILIISSANSLIFVSDFKFETAESIF